jgi:hypothetical protein
VVVRPQLHFSRLVLRAVWVPARFSNIYFTKNHQAAPEIGSAWFVKSWAFLAARRSGYASQQEEVNLKSFRGFPGLRVSASH